MPRASIQKIRVTERGPPYSRSESVPLTARRAPTVFCAGAPILNVYDIFTPSYCPLRQDATAVDDRLALSPLTATKLSCPPRTFHRLVSTDPLESAPSRASLRTGVRESAAGVFRTDSSCRHG